MNVEMRADTTRAINRYKQVDRMVDALFPSINLNRTLNIRGQAFELGRESVHMTCIYKHKQDSFDLASYFKETGHCLFCENLEERFSNEGHDFDEEGRITG